MRQLYMHSLGSFPVIKLKVFCICVFLLIVSIVMYMISRNLLCTV